MRPCSSHIKTEFDFFNMAIFELWVFVPNHPTWFRDFGGSSELVDVAHTCNPSQIKITGDTTYHIYVWSISDHINNNRF